MVKWGTLSTLRDRLTVTTSEERCHYPTLAWVHIAGSANGRPAESGSVYYGSNPYPATRILQLKNVCI